MKHVLVIILFLLALPIEAQSAKKYDLYYIAIGSSHYINDEYEDSIHQMQSIFRNINGANKSARLLADFLNQRSAKGIVLNSSPETMVTRKQIFGSIDSLKQNSDISISKKPFLVFYYCGHGISEVTSQLRFLIPGNMTGDISHMHVDEKKANAVCVNDIYDSLSDLKIPFLLLLDCCADKETEYYESLSAVFSGTNVDNLENILDVMRAWFKLDGDYPIVCSADLGNTSFTVADPLDADSTVNIGPICRRILLSNPKKSTVNLNNFVKKIISLKDSTATPVLLCDEKLLIYKAHLW